MANNVDPNQMPHSAASDLDIHCSLMPVCPSTEGKCNTFSGSLFSFSSSAITDKLHLWWHCRLTDSSVTFAGQCAQSEDVNSSCQVYRTAQLAELLYLVHLPTAVYCTGKLKI